MGVQQRTTPLVCAPPVAVAFLRYGSMLQCFRNERSGRLASLQAFSASVRRWLRLVSDSGIAALTRRQARIGGVAPSLTICRRPHATRAPEGAPFTLGHPAVPDSNLRPTRSRALLRFRPRADAPRRQCPPDPGPSARRSRALEVSRRAEAIDQQGRASARRVGVEANRREQVAQSHGAWPARAGGTCVGCATNSCRYRGSLDPRRRVVAC